MRREDQLRIMAEVQGRVARAVMAHAATGGPSLEEVLAESVFQARRREARGRRRRRVDAAFWDGLQARLGRADPAEQQQMLARVIARYATSVCGRFDPRVYALARRLVPPLLGALLNASSPKRLATHWGELAPLEDAVAVQGATAHLRRLHELGTVILAPTHVSNLDSAIVAYALVQMGLPPFVYGAARDLFSNPVLGFFLRHLGAYTVDRRNHDPLYRDVLRAYATLTLGFGYNNLIFPGGARSRSGASERHLGVGLTGCAIPAYLHNLQRGAMRPKVFVVPATLSYQLVLEAETLIDDFLKEFGQARYIITDDEFSRPGRIYDFVTRLFALQSKIYVTVGRGLDPFGNPVDDDGESLDPCGRRIDSRGYLREGGALTADAARDQEYTRELGASLCASYSRDNVVQATHVLARAAFGLLRDASPQVSLLRLIRVGGRRDSLALREVYAATRRLLADLRVAAARGRLRLGDAVAEATAEDLVSDGLRHFAIYHRVPAAQRRGDRVVLRERALLFYYQNRLEGYALPCEAGRAPALSADHRGPGGPR